MTINTETVTLNPSVSSDDQFMIDWKDFSPLGLSELGLSDNFAIPLIIEQYVNGKNLACPMPLLKLKMALKNTPLNHAVYMTATDPNSAHDIGAFCQHLGYKFASFITKNGAKVCHILVQKTG